MNLDNFNLHEWQREKFDDMIAFKKEQKAIKEGMEQGIELGINSTIIEMLKNDTSIEFISKVTKKSIEEIKKIEESMKEESSQNNY